MVSPIEDTPAQKAGLQANDEILEIDGVSAKEMSVKDAADKIRGPQGTSVKLLIKRDKVEKRYEIVRANINVKSVSIKDPKNVKLDKEIGYIRLNSF
ncbi:MAG: PDZ domain-containing protein [Candidatus Moduliflexus flocculans]|nr:PDZ domain-containing protein [Candidatus Moduliflexus flocculans]